MPRSSHGSPFVRSRLAPLSLALVAGACTHAPQRRTADPVAASATPPIQRTLLQHRDVPGLPGWETRIYRIEYAPGVAAPLHHHPVEGQGYVVRGRFESAFEGDPVVTVHAGESFVDRAVARHILFRNPDPTETLVFVVAYTVRRDVAVVETP